MPEDTTEAAGPIVEPVEVQPSVTLVAVYDGQVVYQAMVGGIALARMLAELSTTKGVPMDRQEQTLETLGQDIYKTDRESALALRTTFGAYMPWGDVSNLPQVFANHDLTMFFVVSY